MQQALESRSSSPKPQSEIDFVRRNVTELPEIANLNFALSRNTCRRNERRHKRVELALSIPAKFAQTFVPQITGRTIWSAVFSRFLVLPMRRQLQSVFQFWISPNATLSARSRVP